MPAPPQLHLQLIELGGESLLDRLAPNDESAGLPGLATYVGEAQKVEYFRFALAAPLSVFGRMAPKLNQARLIRV